MEVNEEQPYSEVIVTVSIRILHDGITRSRMSANIYPDPMFNRVAKKELLQEQWGINEYGQVAVNFAEHWIDIYDDWPRFDANVEDELSAECLGEMNRLIHRSVNWVFDHHTRAMQKAEKAQKSESGPA